MTSKQAFYRPYFNEETGQIAMLSDEQFALLGPESPWREVRPGDPLTPATEYKPESQQAQEGNREWQLPS